MSKEIVTTSTAASAPDLGIDPGLTPMVDSGSDGFRRLTVLLEPSGAEHISRLSGQYRRLAVRGLVGDGGGRCLTSQISRSSPWPIGREHQERFGRDDLVDAFQHFSSFGMEWHGWPMPITAAQQILSATAAIGVSITMTHVAWESIRGLRCGCSSGRIRRRPG
jgi:hypothetical protein